MNKKTIIPLSLSLILGSFAVGAYESISSLSISATNVFENTLSGTEIADLSTIGGEGPYQYSLTVSGVGMDNDKFYISGSKLYLNFDVDYEIPTDSGADNKYTIEVKTLDSSLPLKYEDDYSLFYKGDSMYKNGVYYSNSNITAYRQDGSVYQFPEDWDITLPNDTGFVSVVPNGNAYVGLRANGTAYSWGQMFAGASRELSGTFIKAYSVPNVFAVLRTDGSILTLGTGDRASGAPIDSGYIKIASNFGGFTAIKADGSLYSWGDIDQNGIIDTIDTSTYPRDTGYIDIISKAKAFAAIKADGKVIARGNASVGGTGTYTGLVSLGGNNYAFAGLRADGSIKAWGNTSYGGGTVPVGTGFIKIVQGGNAFAAIKADGTIKSWGHSSYGGSGAPTSSGYTEIVSSLYNFAAIRSDGLISSWGYAPYLVGAPTKAGYVSLVGNTYAFAALHEDGSISTWGDPGRLTVPGPVGTGFIKIFVFPYAGFCALHQDGYIVKRGEIRSGGLSISTVPDVGATFSQMYDIEILDQDEISPIGHIVYKQGNRSITASLELNESGSVINNGGSFEYIFTEKGSFVFEFIDLAGNTGTAIATVDAIPSNGGGVIMVKDTCPDGDNSPSYYDHSCGEVNMSSGSTTLSGDKQLPNVVDSGQGIKSQPTWEEIYQWAKTNGLTTMPDYISARLGDPITRAELAKVMFNYSKGKKIDMNRVCEFDDIQNQNEEIKLYIKQICQIGIMGVEIKSFNPNAYVTRAEAATTLSRSFWGTTYENIDGIYYERHINILKQKSILMNTNPLLQEARGYVFLMLMRYSDF